MPFAFILITHVAFFCSVSPRYHPLQFAFARSRLMYMYWHCLVDANKACYSPRVDVDDRLYTPCLRLSISALFIANVFAEMPLKAPRNDLAGASIVIRTECTSSHLSVGGAIMEDILNNWVDDSPARGAKYYPSTRTRT